MENCFNQPIKCYIKAYEALEKLLLLKEMITQLVTYLIIQYLKENYKMISIDLSKQLALDANPKPIQQISFTANLGDTIMFFLIE